MNTPVDFELSKMLKEKGFDDITNLIYMTNHTTEVLFENINQLRHSDGNNPFCSAPTIAEVVCWIYSKYQIWIEVSILKNDEWHYSIRRKDNNWNIDFPTKEKYNSMENAYEKGINVVLNTYKPKS